MDSPQAEPNGISRRGFASMSPEHRKEMARIGGRAVPAEKRSFAKDRSLAREAGRRGGMKSRSKEEA